MATSAALASLIAASTQFFAQSTPTASPPGALPSVQPASSVIDRKSEKLIELDISSNNLNIEDLSPLLSLEDLYWLYLAGNNLSIQAVDHADIIKQNGAWVFIN